MAEETENNFITLKGGINLTPEESREALDKALVIISKIGTTGAEDTNTIRDADKWMRLYYPSYL